MPASIKGTNFGVWILYGPRKAILRGTIHRDITEQRRQTLGQRLCQLVLIVSIVNEYRIWSKIMQLGCIPIYNKLKIKEIVTKKKLSFKMHT